MISIRDFAIGDEQEAWDVFYSSIHHVCSSHYTIEQVQAWAPADFDQSLWDAKIRSIKPFVAVLGGKIIGYADLQDDGKIDHFFVHGDHQAQGAGGRLMARIIKHGLGQHRLYSEVSHTAKPFFESFGFKVLKVQEVNIRGAVLTNNFMERSN